MRKYSSLPFFQKVRKCIGVVLAGGYGMIERHDVPEGQTMLISRGLFFAAREDANFQVGLVGGLKNLCCTGGGIVYKFHGQPFLFFAVLLFLHNVQRTLNNTFQIHSTGPCVVYTQSKNPVQLLRDFGIPGGRKSNVKYAQALKVSTLVSTSSTFAPFCL